MLAVVLQRAVPVLQNYTEHRQYHSTAGTAGVPVGVLVHDQAADRVSQAVDPSKHSTHPETHNNKAANQHAGEHVTCLCTSMWTPRALLDLQQDFQNKSFIKAVLRIKEQDV